MPYAFMTEMALVSVSTKPVDWEDKAELCIFVCCSSGKNSQFAMMSTITVMVSIDRLHINSSQPLKANFQKFASSNVFGMFGKPLA